MLDFLILGTLALGLLALAANVLTAPGRSRRPAPARPRRGGRSAAATSWAGRARPDAAPEAAGRLRLTEDEWKARLTPEQYRIARGGGTERPFSGAWWDHHDEGVYACAACGQDLFRSEDKYDSGTGWPSYTRPASAAAVDEHKDISYGLVRTEVVCSRCESHLGHVFPDGPRPTGRRYCINSAALTFRPAAASPLMTEVGAGAPADAGVAGAS